MSTPFHIVMAALDADVIKALVEIRLGNGIIASLAFEAKRDSQALLRPRLLLPGLRFGLCDAGHDVGHTRTVR